MGKTKKLFAETIINKIFYKNDKTIISLSHKN